MTPNSGACVGGSSEDNTANRDCMGGSRESGPTITFCTKVWPMNTPYPVVLHVCSWTQSESCCAQGIHQILAHVLVGIVKMVWGIYSLHTAKKAVWT